MSAERLMDLLVSRALGTLERDEVQELAELEARIGSNPMTDGVSLSEFGRQLESTAAEAHAALVESDSVECSAAFQARLTAQGVALVTVSSSARSPQSKGRSIANQPGAGTRARTWVGWLVAAAALVVLFVQSDAWKRWTPEPTAAEARATMVARAGDLVEAPWAATEDPLVSGLGVAGDVVWSPQDQTGFLRIENLPVNDVTKHQYQVWIFDRDRSADHPVSGGVFDVGSTGELVIPIHADYDITEPFLFAITVERPGGVVVSEREHLVLLASVPE